MSIFNCKSWSKCLAFVSLLSVWQNQLQACTGIVRKAEDGAVIYGRTMEFGADLISFDLLISPRGYEYSRKNENGKADKIWQNRYGYVGFSPFGLPLVADGLNEKGMSVGAFYFPGYAEFEKVSPDEMVKSISNLELSSWILANFATVEEVKKALENIKVYGAILPEWGFIPPLHFIVVDQSGASIVIEYVKGKREIYDNSLGVITNAPTYGWHMTNIRNYIGLSALNHPSVKIDTQELKGFGQGSGAIGLPGDFSSPSRFVRALFFSLNASRGSDGPEAVEMAFKILNSFDIPQGVVRAIHNGKTILEVTQWTSTADLKNKKYYFHTYHNPCLRVIDLNEVSLDRKDAQFIKVAQPIHIQDLSSQLK